MKPSRRSVMAAAAAALTLAAQAHAQAQAANPAVPKAHAAWARPTVQGQAGGGGYLTITGGNTPDRLVGVSARIAKSVELHAMEMDGNMMRMRQIDAIPVPAGQTVELKPGGMHVMFVGLTQTLKKGAHFPLTLRFEKAGDVTVEMVVAAAQAVEAPAHKH